MSIFNTGDQAIIEPVILNLSVALGVGLLVGLERERRKGEGPSRSSAGIRTFAIVSLAGAVSFLIGGVAVLAVTTAGVISMAVIAYWRRRDDDPGLTTEVALVLTSLLGGLCVTRPALAAAIAVIAAVLLAARTPLHRFVRSMLTDGEARDGLTFAGATLVVLPLLPDRALGPYGALNLHSIWIIVILVLAISAAGYAAVRLLGTRLGLPLSGLASGFISSIATIGAMGARAKKEPGVLKAAVAGAVLSTVATIIQMASVVAATSLPTLRALSVPLIGAGVAACVYGSVFTIQALRSRAEHQRRPGRAFSLSTALVFALTLSAILVVSAAFRRWFGESGAIMAAAVAGLVDAHAAAVSIATLVASGKMSAAQAVVPILAGFSTNTISKLVLAQTSGGRSFALRVVPGLLLVAIAAWAGAQINGA